MCDIYRETKREGKLRRRWVFKRIREGVITVITLAGFSVAIALAGSSDYETELAERGLTEEKCEVREGVNGELEVISEDGDVYEIGEDVKREMKEKIKEIKGSKKGDKKGNVVVRVNSHKQIVGIVY